MRSFGASFTSCVVLAISVVALSVGMGRAQGGSKEPAARIIDLELSELEIGKAVAYLFAKVNGKYTIASDVKGITTVSLRQVPFEAALANVLKQVNATWRIRDGVYEVVLKPQPQIDWARVAAEDKEREGEDVRVVLGRLYKNVGVVPWISPQVQGRIRLSETETKNLTFEATIQQVLKQVNATYRVVAGQYEIVPQDPQNQGQQIVDIRAENEEVREVLRRLFKNIGVSYSIAPEVSGAVTVQLSRVTFESALSNILRQVDATFRVEAGIYMIVKPRIRIGGGPQEMRLVVQESETGSAPIITMDERHLFILMGKRLYKVNKSDLKTVVSTLEVGSDSRDQARLGGSDSSQGTAMAVDGKFVYILRGLSLSKVDKSDLKTVVKRKLGE